MKLARIGAVAAWLVALGATDCRQLGKVHELSAASEVCSACVSSHCGSAESACLASTPTCAPRLDCEMGCDPDDVACRTACMVAPVGDAIGTVDACAETTCSASCAEACGDLLPIVPASDAQACMACIAAQCCAEATTCGTSADCNAGLECARAGSVPDVIDTCTGARHPAGTAAFQALAQCVKGSCPDECAYGANWSCLGAVKVPSTASSSIQGTLTVVDGSAQNQGVPNVQVVPCYITDEACATPLSAPVTTDASGAATVTVPTSSQEGREGFDGYFQISDPSGTYVTSIGIPGFTLTQTDFTQTVIVVTLSEGQELASALGEKYDATTGSLVSTAFDCALQPAAGSTFAFDNATTQTLVTYPFEGIPSRNTKSTDATGTCVTAFLPPGAGLMTVTNALNQVTSKTAFFTRAGALTVVLGSVNQ